MKRKSFLVPIVTEWTPYVMTIGAVTTPPTKGTLAVDQGYWRRNGDSMEIQYYYRQTAGGAAGTGTYLFPIPGGQKIDLNKAKADAANNAATSIGSMAVSSTTESLGVGVIQIYDNANLWAFGLDEGAVSQFGSSNYSLNQTSVVFSFSVTVPIAGWKANRRVF